MRYPVLVAAGLLLGGCAQVATYGHSALEKRRMMNDIQARATMAATCEIAIGSFFRELNDEERRYAAKVCGGRIDDPEQVSLIVLDAEADGMAMLRADSARTGRRGRSRPAPLLEPAAGPLLPPEADLPPLP